MFRLHHLILVAAALAATACSSSSSSTPNTSPNASSTTVTLTTSKGAPVAQILVTLSTGVSGGGPTGVIASDFTNSAGQVVFSNLPSTGQLCVYASTTVGGTLYKTQHCTSPFPARYTLKFGPKMPS
jgi:type IV pilus biogenesis protein CpaD/CtpE